MSKGEGLSSYLPEESELRDLLKPVARRRFGPLTRSLYLAFTGIDEVALSRLLKAHFDEVVFAGLFETEEGATFQQLENLHFPRGAEERWAFVPPRGWDWDQVVLDSAGYVRNLPQPLVSYTPGLNDDLDPVGRPTAQITQLESELVGCHYRVDPERKAQLRKVWRLVDSITEREVKETDRDGVVTERYRPHMTRFGYDALRWCQQDPERRLLKYYRPTDDWQMPESPWYEGLPSL